MGGGNGAKSAQKRERAAKNAGKEAKSQLKVNESAKDIQCKVCFSTFLKTSRAPAYASPLSFCFLTRNPPHRTRPEQALQVSDRMLPYLHRLGGSP
ncbi:hypothetical protein diail_1774 [Diaporthe ilicicola]|nr:hypothetical protein diail_1774 [Diaporthe ilicicola]